MRRQLTSDDIEMFDRALYASMTIVDEGVLIDDCPDCGNWACRKHGCQAPPLKPMKPKE